MANTVFTQVENKQNKTIVVGETFENEFSKFIVDATDKVGEYVVENALDEMTVLGVDTSILVDGEKPSIAEVSYSTRRAENYITTVREDELKKVANSKEAYEDLKSKINANLDEQDKKECWRAFPKVISPVIANLKAGQIVYGQSASDYAQAILDMKEDIRKLKTPSELYNMYTKTIGADTFTLKTFTNRPVIFIRADFKDEIDVEYLTGLYNLEKAGIGAEIITVNSFYDTTTGLVDANILWLTCGQEYAKIYKDFEKRANLDDVRSYAVGKAVTYIQYVSKLVPAIYHTVSVAPIP